MKPNTQSEAGGRIHEVKGKVKEKAGQLTSNPDLEAEGHAENLRGKVQKKIGQVGEGPRQIVRTVSLGVDGCPFEYPSLIKGET